jgi:hypothetical protein
MNKAIQSSLWERSARREAGLSDATITYVKRLLDPAVRKPGTRLRRL